MTIAVDFDGTLCENAWPRIGKENTVLISKLRVAKRKGNSIILWTCRDGRKLEEAVRWCMDRGLIFDAVNDNLPEHIEQFGGNSRKIFAHIYIDDKAISVADVSKCVDITTVLS